MGSYAHQHYVPAFLLTQWHSGADERLTSMRWDRGEIVPSRFKAKSVAKARHLYSLARKSHDPDVKVERDFLGPHVDDPAAAVHRLLLEPDGLMRMTPDQFVVWSRFLVAFRLRSPPMMEHIRKRGAEVLLAGIKDGEPKDYEHIRGGAPEQTLLEWVQVHQPHVFDDLGAMTLPHLVDSSALNDQLLHARWAVRRLHKSRFDLLLCERPLIVIIRDGTLLLALPLAPQTLFVACNHEPTLEVFKRSSDDGVVRDVNTSMVQAALTYVYATDARQVRFVANRLARPGD